MSDALQSCSIMFRFPWPSSLAAVFMYTSCVQLQTRDVTNECIDASRLSLAFSIPSIL